MAAMPPVTQVTKEHEVNGGKDRSVEVVIEGLEVFAHHGLLPGEKESRQVFRFDLRLILADCPAVDSDDIGGTVDYAKVAACVTGAATAHSFDLLERLASVTAEAVLADFPRVEAVSVRVAKPAAPMPCRVSEVAVLLERRRQRGGGL